MTLIDDMPPAVIACCWKNCPATATLLVPPETRLYACPGHYSLLNMVVAMVRNLEDARNLLKFNGSALSIALADAGEHTLDLDLEGDVVAIMRTIVDDLSRVLPPGHAVLAYVAGIFDGSAERYRRKHPTDQEQTS